MSNELPDRLTAFLASQHHQEAFEDLSVAEIKALSHAEYARLTGREVKSAYDLIYGSQATQERQGASTASTGTPAAPPASEAAPEPVDLGSMDLSTHEGRAAYAQYRREAGIADRSTEGITRHPGFARVYDHETPRSAHGYRL